MNPLRECKLYKMVMEFRQLLGRPVRKTQKSNRKVENQFDVVILHWPKLIHKCFFYLQIMR